MFQANYSLVNSVWKPTNTNCVLLYFFFSKQFLPVKITSFFQMIQGLILPAEFESTTLGYIISETASVVLFIAH